MEGSLGLGLGPPKTTEHRRIGRTAGQQLRIQRDKLHIVWKQHPGQQQQQGPEQELTMTGSQLQTKK
jgi:hypothetical protein